MAHEDEELQHDLYQNYKSECTKFCSRKEQQKMNGSFKEMHGSEDGWFEERHGN